MLPHSRVSALASQDRVRAARFSSSSASFWSTMRSSQSQDGSISLFRNPRFNELFVGWSPSALCSISSPKAWWSRTRTTAVRRDVVPHLLRWNLTQNYHGAFGMFGSNSVLLIGWP